MADVEELFIINGSGKLKFWYFSTFGFNERISQPKIMSFSHWTLTTGIFILFAKMADGLVAL